MKKALLATLVGACLASGASAATVDFSYADQIEGYVGFKKKGTYSIAIFLPGDTFKDYTISAIHSPISAIEMLASSFSNPSVWLSSELKVSNKQNDPDIASYDAPIVYGEDGYGVITAQLPETYTIPAEGVYVGCTFTVENVSSEATQYPMAAASGNTPGSFYAFMNRVSTKWTDQSEQFSSAMSVTLEVGDLVAENVSVLSCPDEIFTVFGQENTVPFLLNTSASEPVSSVDFEYSINGTPYTYHSVLPTPVPAGLGRSFSADLVIPAQSEFVNTKVDVKVTKVNGKDNTSDKATGSFMFGAVSKAPARQTVMEEMTCTKCGYCTRGYAALEYLKKNYPEFICISYHNNLQGTDPMTVGDAPVEYGGNPSAALNRTMINVDPYYGTQKYDYAVPVVGDILAQNAQSTPWAINVNYAWEDDDNLTANVEVFNVLGYENKNYMIGYVLVADGLSGTTASWAQTNYYASDAPLYVPELNNFCRGGSYGRSTVTGLVFDDVAISTQGYKGVEGSVPASLEADEVVGHSQTWDLTKIKSGLIASKDKLRIVAFVVDANGCILNAAKVDVDKVFSGVQEVEGADDSAPVEYFNLSGVKVAQPSDGIFIRRQGAKTEKVIVK